MWFTGTRRSRIWSLLIDNVRCLANDYLLIDNVRCVVYWHTAVYDMVFTD